MEARFLFGPRASSWAFSLVLTIFLAAQAAAEPATTRNFVVFAPSPRLAHDVATAAEAFRRDLAIEWLGQPLPDWERPCPIVVKLDRGAGGRTSFMFRNRTPYGWEMEVQGTPERILDSVLPHEVTHTIFATHFGCPLPRWADEGACTTVEHESERRKQHEWLIEFLKTQRGIPFNRMFAMTEYPSDILPLYSQGYSVARFLIAHGGKQEFVRFIGTGLERGDWTAAIRQHYGYESLGNLQLAWVDWVVGGSREDQAGKNIHIVSAESSSQATQVAAASASNTNPIRANTASVARNSSSPRRGNPSDDRLARVADPNRAGTGTAVRVASGQSFYVRRPVTQETTQSDTR